MLIDGALVAASTGAVFETVESRHRGGPRGRRRRLASTTPSGPSTRPAAPSTTTSWSTDVALRVRCLRQLQAAMRAHADELRAMTIAETGSPLFMTRSAQLDDPVESLGWVADLAESYEWTTDLGRAEPLGMPAQRWVVPRARRRGGRHHAVERAPPDQPGQARPGAGGGQHRGAQARPRHAVVRHGARPAHRRGDRHPRRGA